MIRPTQPFRVIVEHSLESVSLVSLMQLYQPIIGKTAVSYYMTLHTLQGDIVQSHTQLFELMEMGTQACHQARLQLESVGLLETYCDNYSNADAAHQTILYKLLPILSPQQFINNALLKTLLTQSIGEESYTVVVNRVLPRAMDMAKYQNISEKYRAFNETVASTKVDIPETLDMLRVKRYATVDGVSLPAFTAEVEAQLVAFHLTRGLDEMALASLVKSAYNSSNSTIDLQFLEKAVVTRTIKQPKVATTTKATITKTASTATLTSEEQQIVQMCRQLTPEICLQTIKKSKNGLVGDSESYYLSELLTVTNLPAEVVSFIVYYLLIICEHKSLFKKYLQQTADEWQQEGYYSVEDAIVAMKKKALSPNTTYSKTKKTTGNRTKRHVTVPSWVQSTGAVEVDNQDFQNKE